MLEVLMARLLVQPKKMLLVQQNLEPNKPPLPREHSNLRNKVESKLPLKKRLKKALQRSLKSSLRPNSLVQSNQPRRLSTNPTPVSQSVVFRLCFQPRMTKRCNSKRLLSAICMIPRRIQTVTSTCLPKRIISCITN